MLHTAFEVMKIGEYQIKPILQGDKDYTLEEDEKLAVALNYPYKSVEFQISPSAINWVADKKEYEIVSSIFHEAFHIFHWKYVTHAENGNLGEMKNEEESMAEQFGMMMCRLWK